MDANTNIAAWMIAGGLQSTDAARDRNLRHLRALKASQSAAPSLMSRLIAAIRPAGAPLNAAACCPA